MIDQKIPTKSKEKEFKNTVPFYELFSYADSRDRALMIVGSIAAIANGASIPFMTFLFGELVDSFGKYLDVNKMVDEVSKVSLKFVYTAVVVGVAAFLQVTCWVITAERQASRIRSLYFKMILRQDIAFFDKETSTDEVVGRISGDVIKIQDAMGEKVAQFIQLFSTFIGGFVVSFIKGWLLTLILLAAIPPLAISGAAMAIVVTRMASQGQKAYTKAGVVVVQTISSIRTDAFPQVASFTGEKKAIDKYSRSLKSAHKSSITENLASGIGLGVFMLLVLLFYASAVWFGSRMVLNRGYTGGDVMNIIFAVVTGALSLGQASPCLTAFAGGQAAAFKIFETINRTPEIDAYDERGMTLGDIQGRIELRDVHFSYPARPDELIFVGFSLSIPSGMTAALVGESGSGKSTVISLIERFYDPQAGEVLIDGVNLKEFQLRWIRQKIGLVSQEPVLFASSIRDNIAYGKDGATIEEITAAAERANASKFIDKMPQVPILSDLVLALFGLNTMVGEHGTQMSGGQKQRIAIARAIIKDPRILLLDEATSALDAESEQIVQEALDRIMVNRTTIIVAHRLSTVRHADMIAVIHRGKIVEKGAHSELLKDPNGAYSQLIHLQEEQQESVETVTDHDTLEIHVDSHQESSQHLSIHRSLTSHSSERNRSRHGALSASARVKSTGASEMEPDNQKPLEKLPEVPLRRLANLHKPELPVLLIGSVAAIISGVIYPIYAIFLSAIIRAFYKPPDELRKDARFWSLMFVVLGVVSFLASPAKTYFFGVAGCQLVKRIRLMMFKKVVFMEIAWFDEEDNSSGAIGAKLSADAAAVRGLVGDALGLIVQNIASVIAGLVIAFLADWHLALVILAMVPLIALGGWAEMKLLKGLSSDLKAMYEKASQVANGAVGSIRTVASFCAEKKVLELYEKKCEGPRKTGIKRGLISGIGFGLTFYAGARLVKSGKTNFMDVLRVFFALTMMSIGISQTTSLAPDATKARASASSVFAIIDRESKIDSSNESGATIEDVKGDIEFQHVSFRYPTRPNVQIFRDLCLAIQSGKLLGNLLHVSMLHCFEDEHKDFQEELTMLLMNLDFPSQTVALVGESGGGKSTVVSLLQRFYNPDSGSILLDGMEIQKFQLRWLRQQMGLVSQEPVLFNDTVQANIAYGKEGDATEAEIQAAAELANAHRFISSLQEGYKTMVGDRGIQLSGGQKQRVAIARAIVKEPKIMLLDEATSALDAESERVVQEALDKVMVNRTTVIVAHRLSTIKGADLIAVVKDGVIIEKGSHEDLISFKDGAYASLVALHKSAS
ncbi:ABC transporter B member 11 [Asimina triloba]